MSFKPGENKHIGLALEHIKGAGEGLLEIIPIIGPCIVLEIEGRIS